MIDLTKESKKGVCNPAYEEELQKELQKIWDNRANLNYSDLRNLKRIGEIFHKK